MTGKHLHEVMALPIHEINLWRYYLSEPRGDLRNDYQTASVVQAIYSIAQSFSGGKHKAIKLTDCILDFTPKETPKTEVDNFTTIAKIFPGVVPKEIISEALRKSREKID